ncbi:hypothetical protein LJC09_05060, partial [Desulfovibrio sp. OttesenSCG-928-F20]|nr:hypothetical protein [Desulfovibrio sp. OttesenSCG-928-F20]
TPYSNYYYFTDGFILRAKKTPTPATIKTNISAISHVVFISTSKAFCYEKACAKSNHTYRGAPHR